jgi:hypothetical protein
MRTRDFKNSSARRVIVFATASLLVRWCRDRRYQRRGYGFPVGVVRPSPFHSISSPSVRLLTTCVLLASVAKSDLARVSIWETTSGWLDSFSSESPRSGESRLPYVQASFPSFEAITRG